MSDASLHCEHVASLAQLWVVCCRAAVLGSRLPDCAVSGGTTGTSSDSVTCLVQTVFCGTVLVVFGALHVQYPGLRVCGVPDTSDSSVPGPCAWCSWYQ